MTPSSILVTQTQQPLLRAPQLNRPSMVSQAKQSLMHSMLLLLPLSHSSLMSTNDIILKELPVVLWDFDSLSFFSPLFYACKPSYLCAYMTCNRSVRYHDNASRKTYLLYRALIICIDTFLFLLLHYLLGRSMIYATVHGF